MTTNPSDFSTVWAKFSAESFLNDPDGYVQITVSPFAARSIRDGRTIGAGRTLPLALAANQRPGYTSGPDLISAKWDGRLEVSYRFDEAVNRAPATGAATSLLHLLPDVDFAFAAQDAIGVPRMQDANEIRVAHPTAAQLSVGAAVRGWSPANLTTVTDPLGYPSPTGSVSYQDLVPAPVATPAPVVITTPARIAIKSSLERKKLVKTRKQRNAVKYSGRLESTTPSCIAKRTVRFEARRKNGKVKKLGKATTNSLGAYSLSLKTRPQGKIWVIVDERPADNLRRRHAGPYHRLIGAAEVRGVRSPRRCRTPAPFEGPGRAPARHSATSRFAPVRCLGTMRAPCVVPRLPTPT